ncbi:MAG: hypothetical protein ACFBSG_09730 [Leptolyngbyaceae cyanobacterium]
MSIQIQSCIHTEVDDIHDRESGFCIAGKILHVECDLDRDDLIEVQVGHIVAHQIVGTVDELTIWADSISHDLSDAVVWLQDLCRSKDDLACLSSYLFVEELEINPKWRRRGIGLKATAAFLEVHANRGFVFLKPMPLHKPDSPEENIREIERLRRFWQRLGLDHFDSEANFLWNSAWQCPRELAGTEDLLP